MHGLCTKCSKPIQAGLARHHRLARSTRSTCRWQGLKKDFLEHSPCSQRAKTPVEELACVSEVLRVLGIKKDDLPRPLEALDAHPNGWMHHNISQFGSSRGDVPHILDTGQHETLPFGNDLVWKTMTRSRRSVTNRRRRVLRRVIETKSLSRKGWPPLMWTSTDRSWCKS